MTIRATISVASIVVDDPELSYINLTADVHHVNAAMTAFINTDSVNQWFYETIPLSELSVFLLEKSIADPLLVDDKYVNSFTKQAPDFLTMLESFVKVVTYKRTFTDAFTLDDLSQIDKDFYGNKGNIFAFTEIIGLTYDKVFTDSYTVDDVLTKVVAYSRSFTDETTLSDSEYYSLAKNPHNTTTLSDSQSKGFSTNAQDSYYFSDNSVSHTSKVLDNYWLINSTFDDDTEGWISGYSPFVSTGTSQIYTQQGLHTIANGYLKFDVLAHQRDFVVQENICPVGTTVQYSFDAKITPGPHGGSFSLFVGSGGLTGTQNSVTFSNSDNQWHTYTGTLVNDGTNHQNKNFYIRAIGKSNETDVLPFPFPNTLSVFNQTLALQEPAVVYIDNLQVINPNLVPELSVTDYTSQALGKSLTNDSISTTEVSNIVLSKALADSFTLDDATQVDKDFYGSKGNVFGFSEVRSFATGKNVTNSVSFTDTTYTDAVKQTNDSVSFTDTDSRLLNKAAANALTFSDTDSQAFGKSLSDSFVLDDFALIDKNFYGAKGNAFGLSEEQAHEFSKNAQDSYYFSDNSVSHTFKVLDNVTEVINSTFDDDTDWIRNGIINTYTIANGYLKFDITSSQFSSVYQRDICPRGTTVQYSVDAKITSGSFFLQAGHSSGATGNKVTFSNSDNQWHTYTGTLVNDGTLAQALFYIGVEYENAVVYIDNIQVNLLPELSVTDYTSQAVVKSFSDTIVLDEALIYDTFTNQEGLLGISDAQEVGATKPLTDVIGISNELSSHFGKNTGDSLSLAEGISNAINKLSNDIVSTSDADLYSITKSLSDSFALDDAAQIDKNFYGTKGNVLGFSDMQTSVSRKVETDVLPLLEELRNKVTKSNSDSVSFGENVSNMTARAETDSVSFTDSHSSLINKVDFNSLGFTDSNSSVFRKSVYDSFALDDIAQVNKNVEATKGNAFNFTESITQVVAYKRAVAESYTFDDDYVVQLNKNLTTDIGITDQVTVVHTLGSNSKALGSTALNTNTLN